MDFDGRLKVLQSAEGDPALLALATVELAHTELPMEERESIRRALLAAAVPHWFDPGFLGALLAVDELEAERLHGQLCALSAVEPFSARGERAVNVHESVRLALREHLRQSDPEWWRTLAERARAHVAASSSAHARIEALHHLFAIDQEAAAAECETLDRDLMQKPEWRQALAMSLSELANAGWLRGSALVESLLIPLEARSQRGETARLEAEVCAVLDLAERNPYSLALSSAQCLLGDVYQSQGRIEAALASYQKSLVIVERLVQAVPSNPNWQRELGIAHSRLGGVYQSQGRRDAALASFQKSLAIIEQLVQDDTSKISFQRDLGIAHSRLGDMYKSQGRRDAAFASFQKYLAIIEQLVQKDPSNTSWQRDLSAGHSRLGDVYTSQGKHDEALASFQKNLAIIEQLVQDDPSNTDWQREHGVAYGSLGNVFNSQGKHDEALASVQKFLAIIERLVQAYPSNAELQHDLGAAHSKLGDVYRSQGRRDAALASFQKSLAIIEQLVQDDPSNADWQRELGVAHAHLGDLYESQGRREAALASLHKSLAIIDRLVQDDPSNALWKRDLDTIKDRLGKATKRQRPQKRPKGFFEAGERHGGKRKPKNQRYS
jgi:tetratricopeptide (TPR) repeat protein